MTELMFDGVEIADNVDCTRDEYFYVSQVLDGVPLDEIVCTGEERKDRIEKIHRIARRTAKAHGIPLGTPTTSKEILSKLAKGKNTATVWVAQIVRQKLYGIIWSAPGDELLDAINTVRKDKEITEKLSIDNILLLGKIKLQECNMTNLSKYRGTSTAASTGVVDRLEKLWYIKRNHSQEDRRAVFLRLTQKGRDFLQAIETELTK